MKRLLILLLLLVIACSLYFFLDGGDDKKMTALKSERNFSLDNLGQLQKIIITERNKKPVILVKSNDDTWQLNNKYLARENAVDNLLEVIKQVQIKYIPEKAAINNILEEMRTIGVQVDLYAKDDKLLKSYQVGGATQDERGTYMIMNNDNATTPQPFVMQIPSIEGSVRGRFILSEKDWRDRAIINGDTDDLSFIHVEYPSLPNESFRIKVDNDEFNLLSENGDKLPSYNKNKVKGYVQGFDKIYAEYIDNQNPLRDSISNLVPFSKISFATSETDTKTIKLFPLSDLLYERGDTFSINQLQQVGGRYFVDCSWGDFMLVQHRLIGKLLRGKSFFESK